MKIDCVSRCLLFTVVVGVFAGQADSFAATTAISSTTSTTTSSTRTTTTRPSTTTTTRSTTTTVSSTTTTTEPCTCPAETSTTSTPYCQQTGCAEPCVIAVQTCSAEAAGPIMAAAANNAPMDKLPKTCISTRIHKTWDCKAECEAHDFGFFDGAEETGCNAACNFFACSETACDPGPQQNNGLNPPSNCALNCTNSYSQASDEYTGCLYGCNYACS